MNQRLRISLALVLIFIVGTFQYAMPLLLDDTEPTENTTSSFSLDMSYETTTTTSPQVRVSDYGDVEQGSFFLHRDDENGFVLSPLLDTDVEISVTGLIARARVTQTFTNTSEQWVNGIYVFPLPENAAVDHLAMRIGERNIVGEIHPKQKAKAIYQQAKRDGKKASLLVQQRPNLFTNSVANIGPGERIEVTIEYQQSVHFDANTFSLRFPTTLTERYLPPSNAEQSEVEVTESGWGISQPLYEKAGLDDYNQHGEPIQKQHKVTMNVTLEAGFELQRIHSEFHPIVQTQTDSNGYKISLKQDMIANRDFVLSWQPMPNQNPEAAHFVQHSKQGHYGMIMLMPPDPQLTTQRLAREVVFIIDTSGSMSGESMYQAKAALTYAVDALHQEDTFNVIDFDSSARELWSYAKSANAENKTDASQYIQRLSPEGGTEMMSALQLALAHKSVAPEQPERLRQIIFITDGSVGNEAQLFAYIQNNLRHNRLFTVGIGSAPNSFFMTDAARMGRGTFTYIGSIDAVQVQMQTLFERLAHPTVADVLVNFSNDVEYYPRNIPDLYKGQPMMISYKSPSPLQHITITGTLKNRYWQKSMSLQQGAEQTGLDVLWARRKIAQLSRDKILGGDHDNVNAQIQDVAMAHHLVSSMTSLVAVDQTPTALDVSQDAQVKNHAPEGQLRGMLPQTATPATLQFLLALLFMGLGLCTVIFTKSR